MDRVDEMKTEPVVKEREIPEGFERNIPTPEGRALGAQLARFFDLEYPKAKAKFPSIAERCKSCAFRLGTFPNGCLETSLDALRCSVSGEPFYCHMDMEDGKPTKLCAGWAVLQGGRIKELRGLLPEIPRFPVAPTAKQEPARRGEG
jgi:hypothetical protein